MTDDLPRSDECDDMPPRSILFTKQDEQFWRTARRFTVMGQPPFVPFFVDTAEFGRLRGLVRVHIDGRATAIRRVKDVYDETLGPRTSPVRLKDSQIDGITSTEMILTPSEALRMAQELVRVAGQAQERGYVVKGAGMGDPTV